MCKGSWGAKVEFVISHLLQLQYIKSPVKVLIFSQWAPLLHLISSALMENDIVSVSLIGSAEEKSQALQSFNSNPKIKAILLNSRADASGLTLISASHVILMEPNANPAIGKVSQAFA